MEGITFSTSNTSGRKIELGKSPKELPGQSSTEISDIATHTRESEVIDLIY